MDGGLLRPGSRSFHRTPPGAAPRFTRFASGLFGTCPRRYPGERFVGRSSDLFAVGIVTSTTVLRRRLVFRGFAVAAAEVLVLLLVACSFSPPGHRILDAVCVRWSLLTITPLAADKPRMAHEGSIRLRFQNALCMARLASRHPLRGVWLGQRGGPWCPHRRGSRGGRK
jgi:hypothetical protein